MDSAKQNAFTKLTNYFKEVKAEMKKVVWPSWKKVRQNTITVIVYVLIVGIVICGLDQLFTWLMSLMVNR
ncbi:MAG: preprotein translocase subunit SecE [Prevotellaceae bacterium]|nr:preprotein translocase subunit SecE [Prevotellaceae bacterium]